MLEKIRQLLSVVEALTVQAEEEAKKSSSMSSSVFILLLHPLLLGLRSILDDLDMELEQYITNTDGKVEQLYEVRDSLNQRLTTTEEELKRTKLELQTVKDAVAVTNHSFYMQPLRSQGGLSHRTKFVAALGKKIHAIKCMREETGAGLADAKHAIELFCASSLFGEYSVRVVAWCGDHMATPVKNIPDIQVENLAMMWAREMGNSLVEKPNFLETPGKVRTIDHLMDVLSQMRERSPLKGETCIILCRAGAATDLVDIDGVTLEYDANDGTGQIEIFGTWEDDNVKLVQQIG
jgi:ribosomal protein L7/L12